ncbi:MAG: transposase [Armatimonadetes bacterium]|nr:transposase [Armatimonadota bacterium]
MILPQPSTSGESEQRGSITKTGNSYCRHALGQAAWSYRFSPSISNDLRRRQESNLTGWGDLRSYFGKSG